MKLNSSSKLSALLYFSVMLLGLTMHSFGIIIGVTHCVFSIGMLLALIIRTAIPDVLKEIEDAGLRILPSYNILLFGKETVGGALPIYIIMFLIGLAQFSGLIPRVVLWAYGGGV